MNRPPHVQRAIDALMDFTARAGQIPFGDCCEVSHYVARLERDAAEFGRDAAAGEKRRFRLSMLLLVCQAIGIALTIRRRWFA